MSASELAEIARAESAGAGGDLRDRVRHASRRRRPNNFLMQLAQRKRRAVRLCRYDEAASESAASRALAEQDSSGGARLGDPSSARRTSAEPGAVAQMRRDIGSLPRAADGVDAELRRVARPDRRRAERAAELAVAWVVALELVVDPRDPRAGHAPTVVGLQLGRRRHDERRRLRRNRCTRSCGSSCSTGRGGPAACSRSRCSSRRLPGEQCPQQVWARADGAVAVKPPHDQRPRRESVRKGVGTW